MFLSRLISQHIRTTRDARLLGLYSLYKTASFPKSPVVYQGIHTSQQDNDRSFVYKPYVKPKKLDHDHKNMALNRPMSPHVTHYALTLPAGTSITQRVCGAILSFYTLMIAGGALFLPSGLDSYATTIESLNLSATVAQFLKFVLIYPFFYHYFIALRFIGFNMLFFINISSAYQTAYMALAASVVTAGFCAFVAG